MFIMRFLNIDDLHWFLACWVAMWKSRNVKCSSSCNTFVRISSQPHMLAPDYAISCVCFNTHLNISQKCRNGKQLKLAISIVQIQALINFFSTKMNHRCSKNSSSVLIVVDTCSDELEVCSCLSTWISLFWSVTSVLVSSCVLKIVWAWELVIIIKGVCGLKANCEVSE